MIVIGEKINGSIPRIKEAIIEHEEEFLIQLAMDQEKAGAEFIDINVGTGEGALENEIDNMEWLVDIIKENINGGLCVDSAEHRVLEAGLKVGRERAGLVNSIKATDKNISEVLPLVAEYDVNVIGLAMDEKGIPLNVSGRLKACEKIVGGAEEYGIPARKIFLDPLVIPVSTDNSQGMVTLETLREIKNQFPEAKTFLGLSNISFGLPGRSLVNRSMLHMAMLLSVDALLCDPLDSKLMAAIKAGKVVLGRDEYCKEYIRAFRKGKLG